MGTNVASAGKRMGTSLGTGLKAGIQDARASLKSMLSELKGGLKTAATLGGAIGFGTLVKGAVDAEDRAARLGSTLSVMRGTMVNTTSAQELLNRVTKRTKTSFDEVGKAANILAGVKDPKQFEEALVRSSQQAKRLGTDVSIVAKTHLGLLTKGVVKTAKEAEGVTQQFAILGRTILGVDPDEAIDPTDIREAVAFTNRANISIADTLTILGAVGGKTLKDLGESTETVEELANVFRQMGSLGDFRKKLKIAPEDLNTSKSAVENMLTVLKTGGPDAFKKMLTEFGSERNKDALRQLLGDALTTKVETGTATKEEIAIRAVALEKSIEAGRKNSVDFAKIQALNAELAGTAASNFQDALTEVQKAFQQPEMISAINSLAKSLPALAEGFAVLVQFAIKFPLLLAIIGIGGKAGAAGLPGFIKGTFSKAGKGGELGGAGGPSVINVSTATINVGAAGGAASVGETIGKSQGKSARKFFNPADVGKVVGTLAAGAIAFEIGREAIEAAFKEKEKSDKKTSDLLVTSGGKFKTEEDREAALTSARKELAKVQEQRQGGTIFGSKEQSVGEAAIQNFTANLGRLGSALGLITKDEATDLGPAKQRLEKEKDLVATIATIEAAKKREADAADGLARSAGKAAKALDEVGKKGGGRGPKSTGDVLPGASPVD